MSFAGRRRPVHHVVGGDDGGRVGPDGHGQSAASAAVAVVVQPVGVRVRRGPRSGELHRQGKQNMYTI